MSRPQPLTYARLLQRIEQRDERIAKLEAKVRELRDEKTRWRRAARVTAAMRLECVECGAGSGHACVTPSGSRTNIHHLRGRTTACGPHCPTCLEWFA